MIFKRILQKLWYYQFLNIIGDFMKKIVILSCLGVSLFAAGDYIPLSKLSDDEKVGYNFTDKKDIIKPVESKNYTSVSKKNNEIIWR